ncbi:MAG: Rieske 2Fe-2S domain-containing protein [Porticoccaceae bacterium]
MNERIKNLIASSVVEDESTGDYKVSRQAFTDEDVFDLEMKHIIEGNWIYAAHESQLPKNNSYYTLFAGRRSVLLTRDNNGELHAFLNACSHRGATLCRDKKGSRPTFVCPFHGWSFKTDGKLIKPAKPEGAGYPETFNCKGQHDLKEIKRLEVYKGFIFISLNDDVVTLDEYLGGAKTFIDLLADQSPNGLEVVKGSSTYTFDGNWKLQAENGADGYHIDTVHWNYVATNTRRKGAGISQSGDEAMDVGGLTNKGGFYAFDHGHVMLWGEWPNPKTRPNYVELENYEKLHGKERAHWMVCRSRNLCLYPNLFLMDQTSTQIRVFRPLSVNKTEVTIYCFAPVGESDKERSHRIRQYEDFFNATGLATPDDLAEFNASQIGFSSSGSEWNDISRGATHWVHGADEDAKKLGISPLMSGVKMEDEGLYLTQHQYWMNYLLASCEKELDS